MRRAAVVAIALSIVPCLARAEPSIWHRAAAASSSSSVSAADVARAAHRAYADIVFHLLDEDDLPDPRVVVVAKLSDAIARSPDVRLRFDRGDLLMRLRRCKEARVDLDAALASAPMHPFASTAWFDLAICAGIEGHHDEEERAYQTCLAHTTDDDERAIAWSNLGEARMATGNLDGAVEAFESALYLRPQLALTWWNLAVARDRLDDERGAMRAASLAWSLDPHGGELHHPSVFFEPPSERWWYDAIVALEEAELEPDPARAVMAVDVARTLFSTWLSVAPASSPYRARATARIRRLDARIAAMLKK
jgi:tetratricopeptide (TPR) repeat protein